MLVDPDTELIEESGDSNVAKYGRSKIVARPRGDRSEESVRDGSIG